MDMDKSTPQDFELMPRDSSVNSDVELVKELGSGKVNVSIVWCLY